MIVSVLSIIVDNIETYLFFWSQLGPANIEVEKMSLGRIPFSYNFSYVKGILLYTPQLFS